MEKGFVVVGCLALVLGVGVAASQAAPRLKTAQELQAAPPASELAPAPATEPAPEPAPEPPPPPAPKAPPPITRLMFPPDGAVLNAVGGVIAGYTNRPEAWEVLVQVNEGPIQKIDLWDGVFDLDTNWTEGENTVLVGAEEVNGKISRSNSVKHTFTTDSFLDDERVYSVHQAMLDNCGNCHVLGETKDLALHGPAASLCANCHVVEKDTETHPDTPCDTCHVPHTASVNSLLKPAAVGYCLTCHPKPETGKGKDEHHAGRWNKLDCAACHFKPYGNGVCHSCHTQQARVQVSVHGAAVQRRRCVRCHTAHSDVAQGVATTCKGCHGSVSAAAAGHDHDALVAERCDLCHTMHGVGAAAVKPGAAACTPCHPAPSSDRHESQPGECRECHRVHTQ